MTEAEQLAYRAASGSWWPVTDAEKTRHDAEAERRWAEMHEAREHWGFDD